jgi:hypothetical protein
MEELMISLPGRQDRLVYVVAIIVVKLAAILDFPRLYLRLPTYFFISVWKVYARDFRRGIRSRNYESYGSGTDLSLDQVRRTVPKNALA